MTEDLARSALLPAQLERCPEATSARADPDHPLPRAVAEWTRVSRRLARARPGESSNRGGEALKAGGRKRIVVCADGTWNSPSGVRRGEGTPTNVWLLYQLIRDGGEDGLPQLKYYHPGVGTHGNFARRLIDGATGRGLSRNMLDCYHFLVEHYQPGDSVYLFGFSRGAYTVRTLAGMVRNCGIIDREKHRSREERERWIQKAFELYRERGADSAPSAARAVRFRGTHAHPDFCIACIGVWDTVGALGIPVESPITSPIWWFNRIRSGFHDVTLSEYVDCAFQALAIDERRASYRPTLWNQQPHARSLGQVVRQAWFAGVHSDVGGGYPWHQRGLAGITLRWMINQVHQHLRLSIAVAPLDALERAYRTEVAIHESNTLLFRLQSALGLGAAEPRAIDEGLGIGGIRATGWITEEELHGSVAQLRSEYAMRPFALSSLPYVPVNVQDFLGRHPPGQPGAAPPRRGDAR